MKKAFNYIVYGFALIGFILVMGYGAIRLGLTNEKGVIDNQRQVFLDSGVEKFAQATSSIKKEVPKNLSTPPSPAWTKSEEWLTIKSAIIKDQDSITKASYSAGVNPRLITAQLAVEQLRLFYTNRELFKTVFYPLKVLGNQSQFSWGVVGLKQETAIEIENNLTNPTSPFYPGYTYEHLLDFKASDHDQERFSRIIDENNRYYSYLYAGLYIKEVETQWQKAGYDISDKPEIISTLFNIGFQHSNPNSSPKSGGAAITIGTTTYSFGSLAAEFYKSNELTDIFPK